MKKFEIEDAMKSKARARKAKAIVLTGAMTFGTLGTVVLATSCNPNPEPDPEPIEKPTEPEVPETPETPETPQTPETPKTYSVTMWGKTITIKDERSDKTASIDTMVSKLQSAMTDITSGLDKVLETEFDPDAIALANGTKNDITSGLNRGFTITISDTAVTSTEKVKTVDNKAILINSGFLNTAEFSWDNKFSLIGGSTDLQTVMFAMQDSGKIALNLKAKNAVQLAVKPAMLAQKGKSLAALDMKKRNNNAMVAMKNAARVRMS